MHINSYLLVYTGTVMLGVLMLGIIVLSFLAVTSVLAVVYGLVHAARRLTAAAVRSRPVVVPGPATLRHSSRTVVVLMPRSPTVPVETGPVVTGRVETGAQQAPVGRAA
ncbi:hypothetical protein CVV68_20235 [Arthrobacter livingstonensis]|uniref:Uncharacterized protein n=2 Tax=Arthrobacter livingstonensis TaxID=670078 RepID=A0A2V5L1B7_9MICC|nr:hypothetical protein CVV68_20235 [Arthrobacter livingstonensis]